MNLIWPTHFWAAIFSTHMLFPRIAGTPMRLGVFQLQSTTRLQLVRNPFGLIWVLAQIRLASVKMLNAIGGDADSGESEPLVCNRPLDSSPFSLARLARSIRPRVFVTVPVLSLTDTVHAPALLDGTIPIDAETARELVGLATSFTRVLTDPFSGAVLGVDAKSYRPPAALRHWVQLRDATCRFPGCTRRAVETDVDHNTEWSKGGATNPTNLGALCRRHHTLKTIGAFTTVGTPPGNVRDLSSETPITWISPTGRRATTTAEPVPTTLHPPGSRLPRGPRPEANFESPDGGDLALPVVDSVIPETGFETPDYGLAKSEAGFGVADSDLVISGAYDCACDGYGEPPF